MDPNINIFRDPRWGRGQETYGEDPYLTGTLGKAFVNGLQGNDATYLKAAACAKHYAIHSGPESLRHEFNAEVSDYDLWDTYLPAFQHLVVNAKVAGVMCAYNAYKGQPCCGNDILMNNILRNTWHFTGYVTSDCGAIDDFYQHHHSDADAESAATKAVLHGTDVECGHITYKSLVQAVKHGKLTEKQLDESVKRLFTIRFRLGMFDPPEQVKYANISITSLESKPHQEQALKMARQSIALLKNDNHLLPLSKKLKKIAVLGPNADNKETLLANYNGTPSKVVTPLEAIREKLGKDTHIYYAAATDFTSVKDSMVMNAALDSVKDADVIIYIGGITPRLEGEEMPVNQPGFNGGDRTSILLPQVQTGFMKKLKATAKPVVFVMMTGSAIAMPWEAANVPAIINAWYGGQAAGTALADVLFGDYNPAGRLPVTFYQSDSDLPAFQDYTMNNRTYRYFKGKPLYPFGYGLSYTNFTYQWKQKPQSRYHAADSLTFAVDIRNTGTRDGDEVAQVYISYPQEQQRLPLKELRQFMRIAVRHGQIRTLRFSIPLASLAKWDETLQQQVVYKGNYQVFTGSNSADRRLVSNFSVE
ncbi:glycoside hydrolase family 3 C-terminal domain-containing protein [Pedobacter sp. BS3]|uniref:glycoside hydrolase family 3 C-terminal domain-containing protein n=1 Tax=Pedobacter sp. BS3 TaxID=2567937 RepID=UPI001F5B8957|nr:glycoside hydrolase family 3 C-terminal domain-containing protein [Pedobacter sp. BS3]